jgi:hypothetical protein
MDDRILEAAKEVLFLDCWIELQDGSGLLPLESALWELERAGFSRREGIAAIDLHERAYRLVRVPITHPREPKMCRATQLLTDWRVNQA